MQNTTDEKQQRARQLLSELYPGLTNEEVTQIQKDRLKWAEEHPIGTDLHPSTAARINHALGDPNKPKEPDTTNYDTESEPVRTEPEETA